MEPETRIIVGFEITPDDAVKTDSGGKLFQEQKPCIRGEVSAIEVKLLSRATADKLHIRALLPVVLWFGRFNSNSGSALFLCI